ncbi:plastocyanin/azurin family copper-binding protein [Natronomonas sp. EA1]|uniref:plastocyanin/azurin family copper-binding protein n=1 Tax=Natronomonas sp. EA1 TaxID=3421655 RepID=UPI003EC026B3
MSTDNESVSRRGFLRAATGAAAVTATAGQAAAQEGNETGGSGGGPTKTVTVGPGGSLVFEPAELEITPGTTVEFVWDSDDHNIVVESQPESANWQGTEGGASQLYDTGHTHTHTFDVEGDYEYYCAPHQSAGMVGTITVSKDAGSSGGGGGGGPPPVPDSAKTLGIAASIGLASTLGLAYFFMRYGGDYAGQD